MKIQTRMRVRRETDRTEILTLVGHPMQGEGISSNTSPRSSAQFIERMSISVNDRAIADIFLSPNISANPLTTVSVDRVKPGETVAVTWRDNLGITGGARMQLK